MNRCEILSALDAHLRWLKDESGKSGRRLIEEGVDFAQGEWNHRSMSCAILFDANFDRCDLRDVDFFQAELQGATFTRAKMANANLTKAKIDGCTFCEASMDNVSAKRLVSCDVDFRDASLAGADLRLSTFIRGDFRRANLNGADLEGCTFDGCRFGDSDLTAVKGLNSVHIESTILIGSEASPVELRGDAAIAWMRSQSHP